MSDLPQALADLLRRYGVRVDPGLTPAEIEQTEREYNIRFPDDLRGLLQLAMPSGTDWPDWRRGVVLRRSYEGQFFDTPLEVVINGQSVGGAALRRREQRFLASRMG